MLIYGNVLKEEALKFSQEQVVDRFKLVKDSMQGSPLYIANINPQKNIRDNHKLTGNQYYWDCKAKVEFID